MGKEEGWAGQENKGMGREGGEKKGKEARDTFMTSAAAFFTSLFSALRLR